MFAQVPGAAIKLPATRLKAAAALSINITDLIVRHAQANVAQIQQSVACNALHSVEARLCRWLLMTQDRTRSDRLPLTQEFLGFMLGVQRTTVTGVARTLQAAGLIRYSRGQIEILDRDGLKAGACECYASVLGEACAAARRPAICGPDDPYSARPAQSAQARERCVIVARSRRIELRRDFCRRGVRRAHTAQRRVGT